MAESQKESMQADGCPIPVLPQEAEEVVAARKLLTEQGYWVIPVRRMLEMIKRGIMVAFWKGKRVANSAIGWMKKKAMRGERGEESQLKQEVEIQSRSRRGIVAAIVLVGICLVGGYWLLGSSGSDPFGGYAVDQVLPLEEIRKINDRNRTAAAAVFESDESNRGKWDTKTLAIVNKRWDPKYKCELKLTRNRVLLAARAQRTFKTDKVAAIKEFERVIEYFTKKYGESSNRFVRDSQQTYYYELFPECVVEAELSELLGEWTIELNLMPRGGWSSDYLDTCRKPFMLPFPETLISGNFAWSSFLGKYKVKEFELMRCLNAYLAGERNDRIRLQSELEKQLDTVEELKELCGEAKQLKIHPTGMAELDCMADLTDLYGKYIKALLRMDDGRLDLLLDIFARRRTFLRERESLDKIGPQGSMKELQVDEATAKRSVDEAREYIYSFKAKSREQNGFMLLNIRDLAQANYAPAQFLLGSTACHYLNLETNDVQWLYRAAKQGYAPALCELGKLHFGGEINLQNDKEKLGFKLDDAKAVSYFKKAAEKNDGESYFYLGLCYSLGRGVSKDEKTAQEWFQRAIPILREMAEEGDSEACRTMGRCYFNGYGVSKDVQKSLEWMGKADRTRLRGF